MRSFRPCIICDSHVALVKAHSSLNLALFHWAAVHLDFAYNFEVTKNTNVLTKRYTGLIKTELQSLHRESTFGAQHSAGVSIK